ncbi:tetratricopeptide repeat protein [Gillisia limnaea]|uniref:SH3 type 3 domain protein n=1 Tax=Gillisia limnaea (strain DSM 15749 / LMG 21470 / R-8282) TaxID=865937 RepID=H2BUW2_GILLR|nr:tetratricopeptide repeat protein [Gillisia limnaea]EHQ02810.1 SH3 type 3 domain protein [Gillisia limnaea DSM 15749]
MKSLLLYFLMLGCIPLMAQNEALFEEANANYNDGNYQEALENYQQILTNGETSAALYFNLANAHYKLNNIAPGVYYYEKALQLKPNDKDIENNLEFARNMVIDDIEEIPETGLSKMFNNTISKLSFDGWGWMAIVSSIIFAILFLLYYFSAGTKFKRLFFGVSMLFLIVSLGSVGFAYQQQLSIQNSQYAIIFSEEVPVRSEPNLRSDELFLLHEGTKLKVLETFQDWIMLELSNGAQGWITKNEVRFL